MRKWHRVAYALFGLFWTVLGILAVAGLASGSPEEVHLAREFGAGAVFLGLMNFWCIANYERRLPVHLAQMVFAALFAGIHWHDWLAGARNWASPLLNSIPFVLLALMLGRGPQRPGR